MALEDGIILSPHPIGSSLLVTSSLTEIALATSPDPDQRFCTIFCLPSMATTELDSP